jgi:hypothetical protein
MKRLIASAALSAVVWSAPQVRAVSATFSPSKDNTLFEESAALSNGAGPYLFAGTILNGPKRRAVMAFDLSSIPSGATINSASLTLSVSLSRGLTTLGLHRALQNWGEGDSNSGDPGGMGTAAQTNDATWSHTFYDSASWSNAGGDYASTATTTSPAPFFGTFTISSTPQLVADLQGWLSSPATNFGWFLIGNESAAGNAVRLDSSENSDVSVRPRLTIDYSVAAPASQYAADADANWDNSSAWTGGVPNAPDTLVTLGSVITAPRTITLDTARTVGAIGFDSTHRYTIAGAGSLTLDGSSCAITVSSGSHSIDVPLILTRNTVMDVTAAASVLSLSAAPAMAAETRLTKTGPGTLQVKHIRGDELQINNGAVKVHSDGTDAGTSRIVSLSVSGGGKLDLADNDLVLGEGGSISAQSVRQMLVDALLTSSAATGARGLGYADNAVLNLTMFSGQTVDAGNVLVKYTYLGDADLNGQVDVADLGSLASAWQTSALWTSGDFDYSGFVDVADLGMLASDWQAGVGSPLGPTLQEALASLGLPSASVPEPAEIGWLLAIIVLKCRRHRRRVRATAS